MALTVTKEGLLVIPTGLPIIYGKNLDWHAVRAETVALGRRVIAPCDRKASVFRQEINGILHTIEATASETEIKIAPPEDPFIGFKAKIIGTPGGYNLLSIVATLTYPADLPTKNGDRYQGMPHLKELAASAKAYFTDIHGHVDGLHATWENDPRSDNYRVFTARIDRTKNPFTAAKETPTGKVANSLGFTEVHKPVQSDNGSWKVDFYDPVVASRRHPFS